MEIINMYVIIGVILIALITELVVNAIKQVIICETDLPVSSLLSLVVAISLCVLSGMDLFAGFGYPLTVPYAGSVFTGIVASLGAGTIYDLLQNFRDYKKRIAVEEKQEV